MTTKRSISFKGSGPFSDKPRFTSEWWKDNLVVITVFGITGSTTVSVVRPCLKSFGITGNFYEGPWSYRVSYLAITLPLYSAILITLGTLAGRGKYFRHVIYRMYGRLIPKSLIKRFQ
jgi:hypothetical protein